MKGYVDRFDSTIAGWAFDPNAPGRAIDIVIEHEGIELFRCVAGFLREDLIPDLGEGEHGFSFDPKEADGFDKDIYLKVYAVNETKHLLFEGEWVYQKLIAKGPDNWLFLNRDSNHVNLRITGKFGVEPDNIHRTALQFASRETILARMGLPYLAIIVPEKNLVCEKFLPHLQISERRPVPLILKRIENFGCKAVYPIDEFRKSNVDLYYRTDTHTNAHGYKLLYEIIQRELPAFFEAVTLPEPVFNEEFCGDLGAHLTPIQTEAAYQFLKPSSEEHFYDYDQIPLLMRSGGRLRGEFVSVRNRRAKKRLLVFGTSSAYHALPLLSCAFSRTLFIWENTFDFRIIESFAPDCVLWLPPERFLPMQVDDLEGLPSTFQKIREFL